MKPVVALLDSADVPDSTECLIEQEILEPECELRQEFVRNAAEAISAGRDADAILLWHHVELPAAVLQAFPRCRVICRNGVGYDNVDVQAAGEVGIPVCNVPDYGTEEVADHAVALVLALTRGLLPAFRDVRAGHWNWRSAKPVRRTSSQTAGIIGLGRIGTAAALRLKALGFRVAFHDPYLVDGAEKALGIVRCRTLDELLEQSDVVSVHTPLTSETRHLIGAQTIARMKPGAMIVNTARGPVAHEPSLVEALRSGRIAGAGLDVVDREPRVDPFLLDHPNCIVTPHSAFYSEESWQEMRRKSAWTVLEVLRGQAARNVINREHLAVTSRA